MRIGSIEEFNLITFYVIEETVSDIQINISINEIVQPTALHILANKQKPKSGVSGHSQDTVSISMALTYVHLERVTHS